ncbi:oligosaccharide flippase family protein [Patescibacteria group bacterium]|nr:oligosaccharide flippase family protein [Patescibacteria group bacterium]
MIEKIKIVAYRLLKKSEKWTKTDMIYLAKGGFWLTLGQGVSSVSSFLLAIAFANLLPKETYGTYKYIMSIVSLLAIPTLAGMNTAIIQAVARGYEGSVIPAFKTKVKWGLLGGLASLALAGYYYFQGNNVLAIAFLISSVFVPFMDSLLIYDSYLNGKKDFKSLSNYNIFIKIISTIVLILTVFLTDNIFLFIASYFTTHTILRLIIFKLVFRKNSLNQEKDPETISYGKHLSLMGILNIVSFYADKLLIFHYLGATELAVYSVAIAPVEQIKGLIKNINILALPKFSTAEDKNLTSTLKPKIIKMIIVLTIMSFCYILIAPLMYKLFFPQYLGSTFYSQLFSISLIFMGPIIIMLSIFQAKEKKTILYQYNIVKPIVKIALLFVLINYLDVTGVIIAVLLSYLFELFFLTTKKI